MTGQNIIPPKQNHQPKNATPSQLSEMTIGKDSTASTKIQMDADLKKSLFQPNDLWIGGDSA